MDYTIEQGANKFRVKGDTDMEVVDKGLYKPGEYYIVDEHGWLVKTHPLTSLLKKYEEGKAKDGDRSSESNQ